MYNEENVTWVNQQLYLFKDKQYNSNGTLDLTLGYNTTEFKYFSQASISFKISFDGEMRTTKNCSLNYSKVVDLLESFKDIINNPDKAYSDKFKISKRFNNDRNLNFTFKEARSSGEKCVIIQIFYNDSNFTNVIIPYSEFLIVNKILEKFEKEYISINNDLKSQLISLEHLRYLSGIENSIKALPGLMVDFSASSPSKEVSNFSKSYLETLEVKKIEKEIEATSEQLSELDSFIGGSEMNNIKLPDEEKDENRAAAVEPLSKRTINSDLINNILKKDISILEDILNSAYTKPNPIESILQTFNVELNGISDEDNKSLLFVSNLLFKTYLRNYLDNNIQIPSSIPMLKYKINSDSFHNASKPSILAIDLLMIHSYLKTYRTKIESKTEDITFTKSLTYLAFRCFTDALSFSVLDKLPIDYVSSSVQERFEFYKKEGFFTKYDENIKQHQLDEITKEDITNFLNNVIKFINMNRNSLYVTDLQDSYFKKGEIKLPTNNNFSTEQIINDIIKIEVARKLGTKFDKEDDLRKVVGSLTNDIKKLYINGIENKPEENKKSGLLRFVQNNMSEVPENIKSNFLVYVENLGNSNFDYDKIENLNLRDLGDSLVKALYLWKPEDDDKLKTNYLYYTTKIKDSSMTKNDIISILTNKTKEVESEWDNISLGTGE